MKRARAVTLVISLALLFLGVGGMGVYGGMEEHNGDCEVATSCDQTVSDQCIDHCFAIRGAIQKIVAIPPTGFAAFFAITLFALVIREVGKKRYFPAALSPPLGLILIRHTILRE